MATSPPLAVVQAVAIAGTPAEAGIGGRRPTATTGRRHIAGRSASPTAAAVRAGSAPPTRRRRVSCSAAIRLGALAGGQGPAPAHHVGPFAERTGQAERNRRPLEGTTQPLARHLRGLATGRIGRRRTQLDDHARHVAAGRQRRRRHRPRPPPAAPPARETRRSPCRVRPRPPSVFSTMSGSHVVGGRRRALPRGPLPSPSADDDAASQRRAARLAASHGMTGHFAGPPGNGR